jgi:hypothetical protein
VTLHVAPLVLFGHKHVVPIQVPLLRQGDDEQNKLGIV